MEQGEKCYRGRELQGREIGERSRGGSAKIKYAGRCHKETYGFRANYETK